MGSINCHPPHYCNALSAQPAGMPTTTSPPPLASLQGPLCAKLFKTLSHGEDSTSGVCLAGGAGSGGAGAPAARVKRPDIAV